MLSVREGSDRARAGSGRRYTKIYNRLLRPRLAANTPPPRPNYALPAERQLETQDQRQRVVAQGSLGAVVDNLEVVEDQRTVDRCRPLLRELLRLGQV